MIRNTLETFYTITAMSICGFFSGSIFNYVKIEAGGLNRFLFIFIIPIIIVYYKKKPILKNAFIGLMIGFFFSDFSDLLMMIVASDIKAWYLFAVMFSIYLYFVYFTHKLKVGMKK